MSTVSVINGVNVEELTKKADALRQTPELADFEFRVRNEWGNCGYSRTTVDDFYGTSQTLHHERSFTLEADEPIQLVGMDKGANPVEHLLHSLVTCLTNSMVYHAALRGIEIEKVESSVKGSIDLRGFMGISKDVRKGYRNIQVNFRVKSDGDLETLERCARFSPVFDVVSRGTEVELNIEKM